MSQVLIQKKGSIQIIQINRPQAKNAVDGLTAKALADAFRQFEADKTVDVAILGGVGGTFCAGADLKAIAGHGTPNKMTKDGDGPMGPTRMQLNKPVIAAINGYAVAGGLELACWCDLRVMEVSAKMGVFCRRWGVPLVDGGTVRLPRLIGMGRAMDLILTGREVGATEALQMGLVNRVVAEGKALEAAIELAESLTKFPQGCMRSDRKSAYEQWDLNMSAALSQEFEKGQQVVASLETFKGATRFVEGKGRHL